MKAKTISCILSRTKYNYSTGMLMSNIYGQPTSSDQSVDDSQASVRPTTEMMSDLNLYVNSCTAATLTNMLAKVIEFTYGSDSAGFDASAHPMYKTQPHDVGFEAILTCIRSLISQNHQTFANVAGEVLVITLIKMIAIRADIVKRPNSPRISDGCVIDAVSCLHYLAIHGFRKVLFPPELISPSVINPTPTTMMSPASRGTSIRKGHSITPSPTPHSIVCCVLQELLAISRKQGSESLEFSTPFVHAINQLQIILRGLSCLYTDDETCPGKYPSVTSTLTHEQVVSNARVIQDIISAVGKKFQVVSFDKEHCYDVPLVELGEYISDKKRTLIPIIEATALWDRPVMSKCATADLGPDCGDDQSVSTALSIWGGQGSSTEIKVYSSLLEAALAHAPFTSFQCRHSAPTSNLAIAANIAEAAEHTNFIVYEHQWKWIDPRVHGLLVEREERHRNVLRRDFQKALADHGGRGCELFDDESDDSLTTTNLTAKKQDESECTLM